MSVAERCVTVCSVSAGIFTARLVRMSVLSSSPLREINLGNNFLTKIPDDVRV